MSGRVTSARILLHQWGGSQCHIYQLICSHLSQFILSVTSASVAVVNPRGYMGLRWFIKVKMPWECFSCNPLKDSVSV